MTWNLGTNMSYTIVLKWRLWPMQRHFCWTRKLSVCSHRVLTVYDQNALLRSYTAWKLSGGFAWANRCTIIHTVQMNDNMFCVPYFKMQNREHLSAIRPSVCLSICYTFCVLNFEFNPWPRAYKHLTFSAEHGFMLKSLTSCVEHRNIAWGQIHAQWFS